MSSTPRSSAPLLLLAVLAALAAAGAGVFLLLRPAPAPDFVSAPAPVKTEAAPVAPVAPPAEPAGAEAVSGRVLRGAEGEEAAAGAVLEVFAADGDPVPFLPTLARGESGADGKFRVGGLEKDRRYRVRASLEGMASATVAATGAGDPVDLRLLAALPVSGTVKDAETKEPLSGARVVAGDAVGTTTGPDGAWRLERVPAEGGSVTASAPGFIPKTRALKGTAKGREAVTLLLAPASSVAGIVLGPDGKPAAGADVNLLEFSEFPVVGKIQSGSRDAKSGPDGRFLFEGVPLGKSLAVSASSEEGFSDPVDAGPLKRGEPATGLELRIAPGATLVVTVLDEAGKPVEGATVTHAVVREKKEEEGEDGPSEALAAARARRAPRGEASTTDAAGVARVRPVVPGKTEVTADKDDFLKAKETVDAPAAAETALTLRLAPGIALEGKVVDELGAPVAEAAVHLSRWRGGDGINEVRQSGPDGTFRIGGLAGKGFDLSASKEGFVQATKGKVDPAAGPATLTLSRAGAIAGVVVDEAGKPIASFSVSTKRTDVKEKAGPMDSMFGGDDGTEFTDEGGKFTVGGLVAGTYTVTAKSEGLAPGRVADVAVQAGATAELKVVLPVGLSIRGIVVRKGEETPVAGASVSVAGGGPFGGMEMDFDFGEMAGAEEGADAEDIEGFREGLASAFGGGAGAVVTDAEGRFVLKGLEAGTLNLKVKAKDHAPTTQKGVVVPTESEVRILVSEGAAIEGTVTDALRNPKAGMTVMLQRLPLTMKMARTDARGRYRIAGLSPGKYLFYAMEGGGGFPGLGGGMKSETVSLEEGKTLVKDHRMGEGAKLTGKVTRGGKPVGGTMVMLLPGAGRKDASSAMLGGSGFAMTTTKEDGSYEIAGLAPGVYTAMVQSGMGGAPAPGDPVEIPAGAAEVRRDIAISRNAVRGIVVDASGEPVEGAKVNAVATGRSTSRAADLGEAISSVGGEAMTGADGKFAMEDMNAGSFTFLASAEGKGSAVVENVTPTEEGADLRVVLVPGVEVTVRVLDADGKPVAGAGIYLSDPRGIDLTGMEMFDEERTGSDGRVTVTAPPGTVHFEAVAAGHAPAVVAATANPGTEIVITLSRGASIEVLVTDAGGSPRAGAAVRLLDAAGAPYAPRMTLEGIGELMSSPATGTDGKYLRADLPAGTYIVRASDGERTADASVAVAAGERKSVTVRLP